MSFWQRMKAQPELSSSDYAKLLGGMAFGGGGSSSGGGFDGAIKGGLGGAASGAAIGSIVPGIGTGIGAIVGGLLGGAGGLFGGPSEEDLALQQLIQQQGSGPMMLPTQSMSSQLMNVGRKFN